MSKPNCVMSKSCVYCMIALASLMAFAFLVLLIVAILTVKFLILGLIANIIGTIILIKYGLPQENYCPPLRSLEGGTVIDEVGTTVDEYKEYKCKRLRIHKILSYLGMVYILLGFVLQLVASCM